MEKFSRTIRGYNPEEVNKFLDEIIKQVESMVSDINKKDCMIKELESKVKDYDTLVQKLEQYERTEETLNKAILMAQKTSDQIRLSAHQEREALINEAKNNANRIVNEALIKAEKAEDEAALTRRNIAIFKRRLKSIVETQIEVIDDIDQITE